MIPDAATTSTPAPQPAAPQAAAPGSQPPPASPAAQPTPVQLLWEVARMAFVLMTRLIQVLQPIQSYYLNQSRQIMRVCTEVCRVMLTIRFAPERITQTQLRHLTRARHILQALFNYTLPLGARTPSSATATANQSPSAFANNATPLGPRTSPSATATAHQHPSASPENATPLGARTPSSATTPSPAVAAVPEVPEVPGVPHVSATPTVDRGHLTPAPSHSSHTSPTSQSPQSAIPNPQSGTPLSALRAPHSPFSPYIPDANTLVAAVRAATLPPNCAGALLENPGEALVRALHELHAVYFSLYPNQPPTPSQSPSSGNPQSKGEDPVGLRDHNPQSGHPQSDAPSVHSVHSVHPINNVHSVHSAHSPSPAQSEISNLKSEIPNPDSSIPSEKAQCAFETAFPIPHSSAPP